MLLNMIKTIQSTIDRGQLNQSNYAEVNIDVTETNITETTDFFAPLVLLLNEIRLSAVTKEI